MFLESGDCPKWKIFKFKVLSNIASLIDEVPVFN